MVVQPNPQDPEEIVRRVLGSDPKTLGDRLCADLARAYGGPIPSTAYELLSHALTRVAERVESYPKRDREAA